MSIVIESISKIRGRSSIATLNVYYAFHKMNAERQLHKLLDTNPVQNQPNRRENNKWPKNLLAGISQQFSTESCANLPLLPFVGHSCLRLKGDPRSCVHFLPA